MNKSKALMVRMGLIETINYDTMTLDERIDFYRKKSKQCDNINENVMDIYYNIKSNNHKPLVIEKITLDRVINKHGKNGLIILSANRFNKSEEENIKNNQELINFIKQNNYSFLPTYGGYRNSETGEIGDYEPSYIVFNYDLNGNSRDFNELKEFGMKMCRQFEQDCITIKEPNKAAYWIDANGNKESLIHHVREQFFCADPVKYMPVLRQIRVSKSARMMRSYVIGMYTNESNVHICQICKEPAQFVEAVEIANFGLELPQMHLCLCKNCASKYKSII